MNEECFPDPETLTDEEKIELIDALHQGVHDWNGQYQQLVLATTAMDASLDAFIDYVKTTVAKARGRKAKVDVVELSELVTLMTYVRAKVDPYIREAREELDVDIAFAKIVGGTEQ